MIDFKYPPHCKKKMSSFKCNLTCRNGYTLDSQCPVCKCSANEMRECPFPCEKELKYMPLASKFCKCKRQCGAKSDDESGCVCKADSFNDCACDCSSQNSSLTVPMPATQCYDYASNKMVRNNDYWFDGSHYCLCLFGRQFCTVNVRDEKKSKRFSYYQVSKHQSRMLFKKPVVQMYTDNTFISMQNANKTLNILRCKEEPKATANKTRIWQLDKCVSCFCKQTILFCERKQCAKCDDDDDGQCCAACQQESKKKVEGTVRKSTKTYWSCIDSNGNKRLNGKRWLESSCLLCECVNGEKQCTNQTCTASSSFDCDDKIYFKDTCCAECLSSFRNRTSQAAIHGIEIIFPNTLSDLNGILNLDLF